jgi:hypothetical protein
MNILVLLAFCFLSSVCAGCGTARAEIDRGEKLEVYEEEEFQGYFQNGIFHPAYRQVAPTYVVPVPAPQSTVIYTSAPPVVEAVAPVKVPTKVKIETKCQNCGIPISVTVERPDLKEITLGIRCYKCQEVTVYRTGPPPHREIIQERIVTPKKKKSAVERFFQPPSRWPLTKDYPASHLPPDVPHDREHFSWNFNGMERRNFNSDKGSTTHVINSHTPFGPHNEVFQESHDTVSNQVEPAINDFSGMVLVPGQGWIHTGFGGGGRINVPTYRYNFGR